MQKIKGSGEKRAYRIGEYILYLFLYTILFCMISFVIFLPFFEEGKCMILRGQGFSEDYLCLQYTGSYLKEMIQNLFDGNLHFSLYDFSLGMGGFVFQFLKTEPVSFLGSFLKDPSDISNSYSLLTLLRIYLMGCGFACYGFYKKYSKSAILAGSMIYTFSMYTFIKVIGQPQYAAPAILLPLLLIGLEQVMNKQNILFYSFMIAITVLTGGQFLYMNTLIMGCYVIIRFPGRYDSHQIKEFFKLIGHIVFAYIFGCCMSLICFLPYLIEFLTSNPDFSGIKTLSQRILIPHSDRLFVMIRDLLSPVDSVRTLTTITFAIVIIPAVASLWTRKLKDKLAVKVALVGAVIMLMVPLVDYIFNGFGTISNNWTYACAFFMAALVMVEFERLTKISIPAWILSILLAGGYGYIWYTYYQDDSITFFAFIFLIVTIVILGILRLIPFLSDKLGKQIVLILTVISVAFHGYYVFDLQNGGAVNKYLDRNSANASSSCFNEIGDIKDDSFYRVDSDLVKDDHANDSLFLDYHGISIHNSRINQDMLDYFKESESVGIENEQLILSLDHRTSQEALASVKYYLTNKDNDQYIPFGFEKVEDFSSGNTEYDLYMNPLALPIAYTYNMIMSRSEYDKLTAIEKQEASLERAVIDDQYIRELNTIPVVNGITDNIRHGELKITENTSHMVGFTSRSKAKCETYLHINGFTAESETPIDLTISINGKEKHVILANTQNSDSASKDFLVNLGYFEKEKDMVGEIKTSENVNFSMKDSEIIHVKMKNYEDKIDALKTDSLEDLSVEDGLVEGKIHLNSDKLLAFSIPYHMGWTAYVDGQISKLYKVNTMYMGLALTSGDHEVRLVFSIPGGKIAMMISGVAVLLYLLLLMIWMIKKIVKRFKNRKKNDTELNSEEETVTDIEEEDGQTDEIDQNEEVVQDDTIIQNEEVAQDDTIVQNQEVVQAEEVIEEEEEPTIIPEETTELVSGSEEADIRLEEEQSEEVISDEEPADIPEYIVDERTTKNTDQKKDEKVIETPANKKASDLSEDEIYELMFGNAHKSRLEEEKRKKMEKEKEDKLADLRSQLPTDTDDQVVNVLNKKVLDALERTLYLYDED